MAEARIVVIEDEQQVRDVVSEILTQSGFEVHGAADGLAGLRMIKEQEPDLALLDIQLPGGLDGMSVCRKIREDPETKHMAVISLTGTLAQQTEQKMLDAGADDYIQKSSFKPNILVSRVRAVLRRTQNANSSAIRTEHLTIQPARREAAVDGRVVNLTPTEFDILHKLASNPDRALPRAELLDRGEDGEGSVDRTVDVHILSIRRKLGEYAWLVSTVWGVGYRLGSGPGS